MTDSSFQDLLVQLRRWNGRSQRRDGLLWVPRALLAGLMLAVVVAILLSGVLDDVDRDVFGRTGAAAVSAELEVVDQPDVAEPGSGQDHHRPVDDRDVGQGADVDELDVLE